MTRINLLDRAIPRFRASRSGLLCIVWFSLGCGRQGRHPRAVSYEGKPIDHGMISFESTDGIGSTTGGMITDGKYDVPAEQGTTPGQKLVAHRRFTEDRAEGPGRQPGSSGNHGR